MIYGLQIEIYGTKHPFFSITESKCSLHEFNTWKELETFLIINMKGTPDEISLRIMDCFSRVSKDGMWIDPEYLGFDIILSAKSSLCFITWNSEISTNTNISNKISNPGLKKIFLREIRNMKIDSLDYDGDC